MKKLFFSVLLSLVAMTGWAQDPITFTQGNFTYTVTDEVNKTVSIAKAAEATLSGALTIPSSVTYESVSYAVTSVAESGFYGTGITSVTIPASVMTIGAAAFQNCESMTSITIADSEEALTMSNEYYSRPFWNGATTIYIGRDLNLTDFENIPILYDATSVTFGDNVTAINPYLFSSNGNLYSITIGNGVTTIYESAFAGSCAAETLEETTVTMGSNVSSIGASAFQGCTKVKSVTLPSKLTTIGANAFKGSGLTSITIPASVMTIGDAAFQNCGSMTSITIADSEDALTMSNEWNSRPFWNDATTIYIGRDLEQTNFENRPLLYSATSVTFGDNVTTIDPYLFSDNYNLSSITIGNGVTTIYESAFAGSCVAETLEETTVTMGSNVSSIGASAFQGCTKVKSVDMSNATSLNTIGANAFNGSGLTSITIPASVTTIGDAAFQNCGSMTSITIADSEDALTMSNEWYSRPFLNGATTIYIGRDLEQTNFENLPILYSATSVTFGDKVTAIDPYLFSGVSSITSVKVPWLTPLTFSETTFASDVYENATLWVPGGTKDAYKDANYWKNFANMDFASYVVSITSSAHGTLAVADITSTDNVTATTLIDRETNAVFTVTPDEGYELTTFTVNGTAQTPNNGSYTIENLLADQTVVATFTPKTYNISYTLDDGTVATANPTTYTIESPAITLNNPTKTGYTFKGWKLNGEGNAMMSVVIAAGSTGDKAYTATWKINQYTITFDSNGGSSVGSITQDYGTTVNAPAAPSREGYTFAGWSSEIPSTMPAENITLVAQWTINQYTISFNSNGGSYVAPITQDYGTEVTVPAAPSRDGYTFDGWSPAIPSTMPAENITLVAQWATVHYTVSITGAGVTVDNDSPEHGDNVVITIAEDEDREFVSLTVGGIDVTNDVVDGQYIIYNVTSDVNVVATFNATKEFIDMPENHGQRTFCCDRDLDFTGVTGLTAYIASGYDKTTGKVLLTKVESVPASTGLLLVGTKGVTYKVPYSPSNAFYGNLFKAVLESQTVSATEGDKTNFLYGIVDNEPGFYKSSGTGNVGAGKAYLQLPTSAVLASGKGVSLVFDDMATAIENVNSESGNDSVYDLSGRKVNAGQKLSRGIYIINGKTVMIK